ncbi:MAG: flagellar basal body-associated FliL family protein [Ignavibacteriae bacterium]|nr:flagellar basal body-associated FliL family protein [Ignavibacteriota bacterium]
MAKKKEEGAGNEEKAAPGKKKGLNLKVIFIGLPLFIIQLVLVYFITANFLVKTVPGQTGHGDSQHVEEAEEESDEEEEGELKIFTIKDLIINPAGTNGQRLLLLSVGFSVRGEEKFKKLEESEVILTDVVLSTLSVKTLSELSKVESKDSLKVELQNKIKEVMPKAKVKNVYFSKYVLN